MSKRSLYECAMRIGQLPENAVFVDWLRGLRGEHAKMLAYARDEADIRQAQGRVQQLDDILNLLDSAPALLDKLVRGQS